MLNAGENVEQEQPSFIVGGNSQWHSSFGRQLDSYLKKLNTLTIWSSNFTPCYLLKELKAYAYTKPYTQKFIAALSYLLNFGSNQDILQ